MNVAALEALPSFALLGPGYGAGRPLLVTGLAPVDGPPCLVYAPFEGPGDAPHLLGGRAERPAELVWPPPAALAPQLDDTGFADDVRAIREAIAAGDVYQVCLTRRVMLPPCSGAALLAAMSPHGLARYGAWVRLPDGTEWVSASPELFFETLRERVHAAPMKGTARADAGRALTESAKDRAELAMITDLVRNDLTPVCAPRSVRVPRARRLVRLPYAVQTVSDVVGQLAPGHGPREVLAALHPGGSVTGAPKRAAVTMIRRLEPTPRGPYCGALGWWNGGRAVFGLLIRTATRHATGWTYGVGGGIVWDSDAPSERAELHVKMEALRCGQRP